MSKTSERKTAYVVSYGETMPAWQREFADWDKVKAFVDEHLGLGDIIFRIELIRKVAA